VREEAEQELDSPVDGLADRLVVTRAVLEEAAENAEIWPLQRITLRPANGLPMAIAERKT